MKQQCLIISLFNFKGYLSKIRFHLLKILCPYYFQMAICLQQVHIKKTN